MTDATAARQPIDWLPAELTSPGRIGLTPLPGRRDHGRLLAEVLSTLKDQGVTAVVCLVESHELRSYGVPDLIEAYLAAGFAVLHAAIPDGSAPPPAAMWPILDWLHDQVQSGGRVLVHCLGGLGRAGTVAACYLSGIKGITAIQAIDIVRKHRSPAAIETCGQEELVAAIAASARR